MTCTCHISCHWSCHKSCNVKYLATHILVLNNNLTILSNVMYPCHKSCTHVICHASMLHVMHPFHMSCIHVTCRVPMSHVMYPCLMSCIHFTFKQSGHFILHVMATSFWSISKILRLYYFMWHMTCHMSYHMSCAMSHVMLCPRSCQIPYH